MIIVMTQMARPNPARFFFFVFFRFGPRKHPESAIKLFDGYRLTALKSEIGETIHIFDRYESSMQVHAPPRSNKKKLTHRQCLQ